MTFKPGQSGNPAKVWQKGQSGNLRGRPKKQEEILDFARDECKSALETLAKIHKDKDAPASARVAAANALAERAWGKPVQTVNANLSILDKLSLHEQRALETALACLGGAGAEVDTDETTH